MDSLSVMSRDITNAGIAENREELLKASRNWAKQNIKSRTYLRAVDGLPGSFPLTRVSAGERVGGGNI